MLLSRWIHSGCLILALVGFPFVLKSQMKSPPDGFRSPVDFPILLSGSFSEIRSNHFHSGIDIRTGGQTGKPIYASADGYVSRIYISPYGFGKALYINHPGGFTTVYVHLDRFAGKAASYTREQQYEKESFAVDLSLPAGQIQVKRGEVIGYSGNSGSSGGPHLHFEIRDLATQDALDPVLNGIPLTDNLPPQIRSVWIFPADSMSLINSKRKPAELKVTGANGVYRTVASESVSVFGNIYFGIETIDYQNGSSISCGVKSIKLSVDDEVVFGQRIDRFSFSDTRYVNAILDYSRLKQSHRRIIRSYIAPGNSLDVFQPSLNRGIQTFTKTGTHSIRYEVTDSKGNKATVSFILECNQPHSSSENALPAVSGNISQVMAWDQPNVFTEENIRLEIPAKALYEDLGFQYEVLPPVSGSVARVHRIHNEETPVHLAIKLFLKPETLPDALKGKALLARVGKTGKLTSAGGTFEDGFVTGTIKEFGDYTIAVDTIPPRIRPLNIQNNKNISKQWTISLAISDEFSGISTYRGTLNGHWILMDFDAKNNKLVYSFDDRLKTGTNTFELKVSDGSGNVATYRATLIR